MIYAAQATSADALIRIGQAVNVAARLAALQSENACGVRLLGVIETATSLRQIHARFAPCRHHGEWFWPRATLQRWLGAHLRPLAAPPTTPPATNPEELDHWLMACPDDLLTTEEAAALVGVQPVTIRRHAANRLLPFIRIGPRLVRFERHAVLASSLAARR